MFGNKDIPVYLFMGFLESGKTTCIREIIEEGNFADGKRSLLILTEEGEVELDDMLLARHKIDVITVENEEEFTENVCNHNLKKYRSDRVIIEVNGMWDLDNIINKVLPENWVVIQCFTTVNAQTFDMYVNNMKSMMMPHMTTVEMKWGRYVMVCTAFLKALLRTSFRSSAKMIGMGKPQRME